MAHGVFRDGLQGQRRQLERRAADVVIHRQLVLKAHLFQLQISLRMLQLPLEGDRAVRFQGIHIAPQIVCKLDGRGFGLRRVRAAQVLNHGEGVVEKMRVNLAEHDLHLQARVLLLLPVVLLRLVLHDENKHRKARDDGGKNHKIDPVVKNLQDDGDGRNGKIGPERNAFLPCQRAPSPEQ